VVDYDGLFSKSKPQGDCISYNACELLWNERNARVLKNKAAPTTVLLEIIKSEVRL
jgi:hypothetical protein